jgi:hypothetical protein
MLLLISSLKLSIVHCAAGPENRGPSRTNVKNVYIYLVAVVVLQLHVKSVAITTKVVSSNLVHYKLYSIQQYQQYFSYMEVVSFIGGGNRITAVD